MMGRGEKCQRIESQIARYRSIAAWNIIKNSRTTQAKKFI